MRRVERGEGRKDAAENVCAWEWSTSFVRYVVPYLFRTPVPAGSDFLVCELHERRLLACLPGATREQGGYSFD